MFVTDACVKCPFCILFCLVVLLSGAAVFGYMSGHFEIRIDAHYRDDYSWENDQMLNWDMQEAARASKS